MQGLHERKVNSTYPERSDYTFLLNQKSAEVIVGGNEPSPFKAKMEVSQKTEGLNVGIGDMITSVYHKSIDSRNTLENFCYLRTMTESKSHAEEPSQVMQPVRTITQRSKV
jgi:hypothetical protein